MQRWIPVFLILLIAAGGSAAGARTVLEPAVPAASAAPEELVPEAALRKAMAGGKYGGLLAVLRVPQDLPGYGEFHDYGHSNTPSWGGFSGLPAGYWVYAYPYWFIWRDVSQSGTPQPAGDKRRWGPEQATGAPDTFQAGDLPTAWASETEDGQDEWLLLEYDQPVKPVAVLVHETHNTGALSRVSMIRADSEEVDLWRGADPTPVGRGKGISLIPVQAATETRSIKLYLDSTKVPGWNEIDAVGLIDPHGRTHWAARARASSTYASGGAG